jgi:hypothetical protein
MKNRIAKTNLSKDYFKLQEEHFVGVGEQLEHGLLDFSPDEVEKKVDITRSILFELQYLHFISSVFITRISFFLPHS